ncbi:hypothetical protein ASQ49_04880 [Acidipropionibacterium acidipropionici]|nr:hypothetical protein ASQ49_04880 [Acidipropionibacterium acidipropionici]
MMGKVGTSVPRIGLRLNECLKKRGLTCAIIAQDQEDLVLEGADANRAELEASSFHMKRAGHRVVQIRNMHVDIRGTASRTN